MVVVVVVVVPLTSSWTRGAVGKLSAVSQLSGRAIVMTTTLGVSTVPYTYTAVYLKPSDGYRYARTHIRLMVSKKS